MLAIKFYMNQALKFIKGWKRLNLTTQKINEKSCPNKY